MCIRDRYIFLSDFGLALGLIFLYLMMNNPGDYIDSTTGVSVSYTHLDVYKRQSQNSLRQHDLELILDFYENLIREKTGRIPDETIHCILEMYCHSSISVSYTHLLHLLLFLRSYF